MLGVNAGGIAIRIVRNGHPAAARAPREDRPAERAPVAERPRAEQPRHEQPKSEQPRSEYNRTDRNDRYARDKSPRRYRDDEDDGAESVVGFGNDLPAFLRHAPVVPQSWTNKAPAAEPAEE